MYNIDQFVVTLTRKLTVVSVVHVLMLTQYLFNFYVKL
jgi:hypothetical protein